MIGEPRTLEGLGTRLMIGVQLEVVKSTGRTEHWPHRVVGAQITSTARASLEAMAMCVMTYFAS